MNLGVWHPQIVHFVIALLYVGVGLRIVSVITSKLKFVSPAATTLILLGTLASVLAVKSGDDAHGPAERIPGARDAVENHEAWGNRTRNLFLIIAVVELAVVALSRNEARAKAARVAGMSSAALGLIGMFLLYETGEHGGEVVYEYAGGVGTRSGDSKDVQNLLIAGLYHNAMQDREAGRRDDAARLIGELERRMPDDPGVRLLVIESLIRDRADPTGALAALRGFAAGNDQGLQARAGLLRVDAFEAMQQKDSATAVLTQLKKDFPTNTRVQERVVKP